MSTATVSSKGWVVIPAPLRRKYDIKPGKKVAIVDYGGVLALVPVPEDPIQEGRGLLRGDSSLTEALLRDRRLEREREGRR